MEVLTSDLALMIYGILLFVVLLIIFLRQNSTKKSLIAKRDKLDEQRKQKQLDQALFHK